MALTGTTDVTFDTSVRGSTIVLTTPELVETILELDEDVPVQPFIDTAAALLNRLYPTSLEEPRVYPDAYFEILMRWLTAHFYSIRVKRTTQEIVKGIGEHYEGKYDLRLDHTSYGQQVFLLDTLGLIAESLEHSKKIKGIVWHVGGGDPRGLSEEGW